MYGPLFADLANLIESKYVASQVNLLFMAFLKEVLLLLSLIQWFIFLLPVCSRHVHNIYLNEIVGFTFRVLCVCCPGNYKGIKNDSQSSKKRFEQRKRDLNRVHGEGKGRSIVARLFNS